MTHSDLPTDNKSKTVALTGGTGFIGGAIIDLLLANGHSVKALARNPGKLGKWKGKLEIIQGDLDDVAALGQLAENADGLIHCAGLTLAKKDADFFAVNVGGARNAAAAAAQSGARLTHISSLSAREPSLSSYAASKFKSEAAIAEASGGNEWVALRVPAVYGPGDLVTLPFFKMVKRGLAPEPAATPVPRASILFVEDVAAAIVTAAFNARGGEIYEIGDESPTGHSWREIGKTLGKALGKTPRALRAPRPILSAIAGVSITAARAVGKTPSFRPGQIAEFFHPDWVARNNLLNDETDWRPHTPLREGFAKTARWYQDNNML